MHGLRPEDPGVDVDWGRVSADYAAHRPGYPRSFFERLTARAPDGLGLSFEGLRVLDLGTGTGHLARALARRGARVLGVDVSEPQIRAARRLAEEEGLAAEFHVAPAEATGARDGSFDLVSASQCWLYFDRDRAVEEVRRVLATDGRLLTCHLCWLPRLDEVARRTEELVLEHNPAWTAADWSGEVPEQPAWIGTDFEVGARVVYDEELAFTHESWRGRIRACRGVGAALGEEAVARFDRDLAALLESLVPRRFAVLHRIDAHLLAPAKVP